MVGPSLTTEERNAAKRRLQAGFVGLVGVSAGLVALGGGATLPQAGLAVLAGLLVGSILLSFLVRTGGQLRT